MVNITDINSPYPIFTITDSVKNGDFIQFFTRINSTLGQLPAMALCFALLFVFYGITIYIRPTIDKYRAMMVSALLISFIVGLFYSIDWVNGFFIVPFVIIMGICWMMSKGK